MDLIGKNKSTDCLQLVSYHTEGKPYLAVETGMNKIFVNSVMTD